MAEMRLRACSSILLAALLSLVLPAIAAATPHPIAKPKTIAPIKPVSAQQGTPPASPPPPPATPPPPPASPPPSSSSAQGSANTGSASASTATSSASAATHRAAAATTVIVLTARGGRDQSGIAVPAPPPPAPTPLALVTAAQRTSTSGSSGAPAWKLALLALLAAGEAFLVVRLLRSRPGNLSTV